MRVEIAKLHKSLETTIIYVTHDQTEAMTLGTRIVVLKDGIIQQVDTPENLYDTPCNKFVAGFIGSPQMNMIDAECTEEDGKVSLSFAGNKITLNEKKATALKEKGYIGKTVTLGIRPENLHDEDAYLQEHAESVISAEIRVYEMLGAETLLYFDIGDASWTARVNPKTKARTGDTVRFALDGNKIHIFDKETEATITN